MSGLIGEMAATTAQVKFLLVVAKVVVPLMVIACLALLDLVFQLRGRVNELATELHGQKKNAEVLSDWTIATHNPVRALEARLDELVETRGTTCHTIGADFHVIAEQFVEMGASVYGIGNNLRVVANRFQGRHGDAFPGEMECGPDDFTVNQASGQRCCARENS